MDNPDFRNTEGGRPVAAALDIRERMARRQRRAPGIIGKAAQLFLIGQPPVGIAEVAFVIEFFHIAEGMLPGDCAVTGVSIGVIIGIARFYETGVFGPHEAGQVIGDRIARDGKTGIGPANAGLRVTIIARCIACCLPGFGRSSGGRKGN